MKYKRITIKSPFLILFDQLGFLINLSTLINSHLTKETKTVPNLMDLNSMSPCNLKEKGTHAFMYKKQEVVFLLFVRSDLKKRHSFDRRLKGKITFTTIVHFCLQMCCDCLYK